MKTKTALLGLLVAALSRAAVITVTFDDVPRGTVLGNEYEESGLTLLSPSLMVAVGGQEAGRMFGGQPHYMGTALWGGSNDGWLGLGADQMLSVSFRYGHDWNFYAIEYGLLTHQLEWQAWRGGLMVDEGFGPTATHHGGLMTAIAPDEEFDHLLVRSTATMYESATWNQSIQGWDRTGGTWSPRNLLAVDDISIITGDQLGRQRTPVGVPDGGSALAMLGVVCLLGLAARSRR